MRPDFPYPKTTRDPNHREDVNVHNRRLLLTTNTELNAIAALAIIGLRSLAAASAVPPG